MNKKIKKTSKILVVWIAFHSIAFVLSNTGNDIFNTQKYSQEEYFWPFVAFSGESMQPIIDEGGNILGVQKSGTEFRGIFYQYDTSELIIYLVLGFTFFGLYLLNNYGNEKDPEGL